MTTQSFAVTGPYGHAAHLHHAGGWGTFARHFAEMLVAMVLGMAVLGMVLDLSRDASTELTALSMSASMTMPMVAWMLIRGHSWQRSAEMAVAMVVPVAALFPLLWSGIISGDTLIGLQHGLMVPSMLVAMVLRRADYGL